jgi:acetolactate synthase-1/2/3 large subunit
VACSRLVVLAGSRSIASSEDIKRFADRFTVPVATTLAARGVVPENSPMAMGHVGFMSHPRAKSALSSSTPLAAERIIAVGLDEFGPEHFPGIAVITAPPDAFKQLLLNESVTPPAAAVHQRRDWIAAVRQLDRPVLSDAVPGAISYGHLVETVAGRMPAGTIHVFDSGQVRRIGVARLTCLEPRTLLVADGMAPMGWAIGAAIGAAFARPDRSVATFVGDGSMLMHGIEVITAARYRLPILFVLCENGVYGSLCQRNLSSPMAELPGVDWRAFVRSLGIETRHADCLNTLHAALDGVAEMSSPRLIVAKVPEIDPDIIHGDTGIAWLSSLR